MRSILRLVRIPLLIFWTLICVLLVLPFIRQTWRNIRISAKIAHLWAKGIAKIISLKIKIHGDLEDLSAGLFVSNHLGYLDVVTHLCLYPLRFAPNTDIRTWPFIGRVVDLSHPVWLDREAPYKSRDSLIEFKETMEHGIPLFIYPEGTSTSGKDGLLPFKSTPFEAVSASGLPVRPLLTFYRESPDEGDTVCWFNGTPFLQHAWKLLALSSIKAEIYFLPLFHSNEMNRKQIAETVRELMLDEYKKLSC